MFTSALNWPLDVIVVLTGASPVTLLHIYNVFACDVAATCAEHLPRITLVGL